MSFTDEPLADASSDVPLNGLNHVQARDEGHIPIIVSGLPAPTSTVRLEQAGEVPSEGSAVQHGWSSDPKVLGEINLGSE